MPYSEKQANEAVRFIQNLRYWKGSKAGENFQLMPWQEKIVRDIFGTLNGDEKREIRTVYIEIPRKNGKSTLCGALVDLLLFADEEPGAEIIGAATDRDQASIVYKHAKKMTKRCPALAERASVTDYRKKIEYPDLDAEYKAISRDSDKAHGADAHGVIFDELHKQNDRKMWDALSTSQGSREEPIFIAITTAGFDRDSVCWDQHQYTKKVNRGEVDDPSHYGVIFSADPKEQSFPESWHEESHPSHPEDWPGAESWLIDDDSDLTWRDKEAWEKANPALETHPGGFRKIQELQNECKRAKNIPSEQNKFKRLYLNMWTGSETYFIDPDEWHECKDDFDLDFLRGRKCYGGLDLSSRIDLTSFVLVFPIQGDIYVWGWYFCPKQTIPKRVEETGIPYDVWAEQGHLTDTPGRTIHYDQVFDTIMSANKHFELQEVAFDQWESVQIVQQLQDERINVVEMRQTGKIMSDPTKELQRLVKSKEIKHNGNPVLNWQMRNVSVKQYQGGTIKPIKKDNQDKIDGVVSLIMALDRVTRGMRKTSSVYKRRGLTTL